MKTLALALLFLAPHIEHGTVGIPKDGIVVVYFEEPFKDMPKCEITASGNPAKIRTYWKEWVELYGRPGDKVSWRCQ